jgi:peptidoglycan/xylan/chitin deacetylase (PgdA/CDA1 family)
MLSLPNRVHAMLASRFHQRTASLTPQPLISFTFDDFPRSAIHVAGEVLRAEGLRATYYGAFGLMGTSSSVGPIFLHDDLDKVLHDGHELACHTYYHTSCRKVPLSYFQNDCALNRETISATLGISLQNFSFPYGDVTLAAKHAVAGHYRTCRTTQPGINSSPVDLAFLRANPIYSTNSIQNLEKLIVENTLRGGWLILYTHDIDPSPSPFGCTPDHFRHVMRLAIRSRAEILTIAQVLDRLEPAVASE